MTAERCAPVVLPLTFDRHHGRMNLRRRAAWFALLALWLILAAVIVAAITPRLAAGSAPAQDFAPLHLSR